MFVQLSIHYPKPGKEKMLIDSMHRFGQAVKTQPGLREVHTLRDQKSSCLVGLAVWDSKESMVAARPVMAKAIEGDDFDSWEDKPIISLHLEET
jgi:heme-degrading monooxygenase HmoA